MYNVAMFAEAPIPYSGVLIYELYGKRPNEFMVLITESITHLGNELLLEGPANSGESPVDCAFRVMQEQAGLQPKSREALIPEFPSPVITQHPAGLLAFSLFSCDCTDTNQNLHVPESQRYKIWQLHFVPSEWFYGLFMNERISPIYLAGQWEKRVQGLLKARRRQKPKASGVLL
jgi:hypothetical protein